MESDNAEDDNANLVILYFHTTEPNKIRHICV